MPLIPISQGDKTIVKVTQTNDGKVKKSVVEVSKAGFQPYQSNKSDSVEELEEKIKELEEALEDKDNEIEKLEHEKQDLEREIEDNEMYINELEGQIDEADYSDYKAFLEQVVYNRYMQTHKDYNSLEELLDRIEHVLKYGFEYYGY